jgi:hypothetical protein
MFALTVPVTVTLTLGCSDEFRAGASSYTTSKTLVLSGVMTQAQSTVAVREVPT